MQYGYQPNFQIQTKICQRARGPHTEGEIYCGKTLTMDHFSKGRAQCKECSVKKTQVYNQSKIQNGLSTTGSNEILNNHIQELDGLIVSLNRKLDEKTIELSTLSENLKVKTSELNESQLQYKKYYDGALEYYNETIKLKENLEDKIRIIKSNSEMILSLQKENRELNKLLEEKSKENIALSNDIKALDDEIRFLEK